MQKGVNDNLRTHEATDTSITTMVQDWTQRVWEPQRDQLSSPAVAYSLEYDPTVQPMIYGLPNVFRKASLNLEPTHRLHGHCPTEDYVRSYAWAQT